MNCCPFAFPTFFVPAGSKAGPPLEAWVTPVELGTLEDTEAMTATEAEGPVEPNPHPVFPF